MTTYYFIGLCPDDVFLGPLRYDSEAEARQKLRDADVPAEYRVYEVTVKELC